jgi:hypothetical protein
MFKSPVCLLALRVRERMRRTGGVTRVPLLSDVPGAVTLSADSPSDVDTDPERPRRGGQTPVHLLTVGAAAPATRPGLAWFGTEERLLDLSRT